MLEILTFLLFPLPQTDYESRKPHIARDITIARAKNDDVAVQKLCAELDSLSHLPYNPLGTTHTTSRVHCTAPHSLSALRLLTSHLISISPLADPNNGDQTWDVELW
jgi:hypothetical protein